MGGGLMRIFTHLMDIAGIALVILGVLCYFIPEISKEASEILMSGYYVNGLLWQIFIEKFIYVYFAALGICFIALGIVTRQCID
jgi:hypothetical protein